MADPSLMKNSQKMLAGELYDPLDPELVRAGRARDLCQDLNATREAEQEERRRILASSSAAAATPCGCSRRSSATTAPTSPGRARLLQLQLRRAGRLPGAIGDFTLFGPAVQIYTAMHP